MKRRKLLLAVLLLLFLIGAAGCNNQTQQGPTPVPTPGVTPAPPPPPSRTATGTPPAGGAPATPTPTAPEKNLDRIARLAIKGPIIELPADVWFLIISLASTFAAIGAMVEVMQSFQLSARIGRLTGSWGKYFGSALIGILFWFGFIPTLMSGVYSQLPDLTFSELVLEGAGIAEVISSLFIANILLALFFQRLLLFMMLVVSTGMASFLALYGALRKQTALTVFVSSTFVFIAWFFQPFVFVWLDNAITLPTLEFPIIGKLIGGEALTRLIIAVTVSIIMMGIAFFGASMLFAVGKQIMAVVVPATPPTPGEEPEQMGKVQKLSIGLDGLADLTDQLQVLAAAIGKKEWAAPLQVANLITRSGASLLKAMSPGNR